MKLIANHKELEKKLSECLAESSRLKKKALYWSTKCKKLESNQGAVLLTKMKDLQDQIKCLENEKLELLDKVQEFEKNRLALFKKGHYINNVRAAYEDLGGASANKIEKVVHIVLNKMQGWG